jgi:hypothetical protein
MPPRSAFGQALYHIWLCIFTLIVFGVFILAFVAQSGAITMPQWARGWETATPEVRAEYAAALFTCVILLFILFFFSGLLQMMRMGVL